MTPQEVEAIRRFVYVTDRIVEFDTPPIHLNRDFKRTREALPKEVLPEREELHGQTNSY